jgi:flavin-binding protein dodecin
MADKVVHPQSTYDVIELIGTSSTSWEDAAKNVIEEAGKHLRELRVAEVVEKDLVIRNGKITAYRTKLKLSFKYEPKTSKPSRSSLFGSGPLRHATVRGLG